MSVKTIKKLEPEKPCWCGYSSEIEPSGCKGSNMILKITDLGNTYAVRCKGFAKNVNKQEIRKLLENIPERHDLRNYKFRDKEQENLYDMIKSKNGLGVWVSGKSGIGKTYLTYLALIEFLRKSNSPQKFFQINAVDLITSWMNKFNEDEKKYNQSMKLLNKLNNATLIFIDDNDKIGNITDTRATEFYTLFNNIAEKRKILFVTSQVSIIEFCKSIPKQRDELSKYGASSILTRLLELCRNAHAIEQRGLYEQ